MRHGGGRTSSNTTSMGHMGTLLVYVWSVIQFVIPCFHGTSKTMNQVIRLTLVKLEGKTKSDTQRVGITLSGLREREGEANSYGFRQGVSPPAAPDSHPCPSLGTFVVAVVFRTSGSNFPMFAYMCGTNVYACAPPFCTLSLAGSDAKWLDFGRGAAAQRTHVDGGGGEGRLVSR